MKQQLTISDAAGSFIGTFTNSFHWGSSEVDWCEPNFAVTSHVVEFWNTVSNIPFFILPPILICLYQDYGRKVSSAVHFVWALLLVIGTGSVYFHATLSLFGQLWDEVAILWIVMLCMCIWMQNKYIPAVFHKNRVMFQRFLSAFTVVCTAMSTVIPKINNIVLLSTTVPTVWIFCLYHKKWSNTPLSRYQGMLTLGMFSMAAVCWVSDRMFCDFWRLLSFQYLHALWHVLIALSSSRVCVLLSYYNVLEDHPHLEASLKVWPQNAPAILAVPYVEVRHKTLVQ